MTCYISTGQLLCGRFASCNSHAAENSPICFPRVPCNSMQAHRQGSSIRWHDESVRNADPRSESATSYGSMNLRVFRVSCRQFLPIRNRDRRKHPAAHPFQMRKLPVKPIFSESISLTVPGNPFAQYNAAPSCLLRAA